MNKSNLFKIKELCWAKIKGFPWWPALIREIKYSNNEKYYNIGYICESKGSDLPESNLKKWEENYDSFKQGWTLAKDKKSPKQNDFECSLAMADKLSEGKITPEEHDKFLVKYKTKKERNSLYNIREFIQELEKEKTNEKSIKKEVKEKKLIGKKRKKDKDKIIEIIEEENKSESVQEIKEEKKEEEIEMSKKDLNKAEILVNNINKNLDDIIIKTDKYQKFFEKECKDKNISYLDDKNITTKIELVKYIQIVNEVFDAPLKLIKEIDNDIKEKDKDNEKEKLEIK